MLRNVIDISGAKIGCFVMEVVVAPAPAIELGGSDGNNNE